VKPLNQLALQEDNAQHPHAEDVNAANRTYSESYTIDGSSSYQGDSGYQGDAGESLAEAFSEEMLAWYEENEQSFTSKTSNSTYV